MIKQFFYYVKRGFGKIVSFISNKLYSFFLWSKKMEAKGWEMHNEGKEGLKNMFGKNK